MNRKERRATEAMARKGKKQTHVAAAPEPGSLDAAVAQLQGNIQFLADEITKLSRQMDERKEQLHYSRGQLNAFLQMQQTAPKPLPKEKPKDGHTQDNKAGG